MTKEQEDALLDDPLPAVSYADMKCPNCAHEIPDKAIAKHLAGKGGKQATKAKAAAARANGKKGGRPKGSKNQARNTE